MEAHRQLQLCPVLRSWKSRVFLLLELSLIHPLSFGLRCLLLVLLLCLLVGFEFLALLLQARLGSVDFIREHLQICQRSLPCLAIFLEEVGEVVQGEDVLKKVFSEVPGCFLLLLHLRQIRSVFEAVEKLLDKPSTLGEVLRDLLYSVLLQSLGLSSFQLRLFVSGLIGSRFRKDVLVPSLAMLHVLKLDWCHLRDVQSEPESK
mmetsp:Transcript_21301/g.38258  ORF Transcript_21301/g.38258 Transcript_21301/m.38258 type:complete len:204 (-) Transcript_21301:45-656(-)